MDRQVFLIARINKGIRWTVLLVSIAGMMAAVYMTMYKKRGFSLGTTFPNLAKDDIGDTNKNTAISSIGQMMGKESNKN